MAYVPIQSITFAQSVNRVTLFCCPVIFWKRLDKHTAILYRNNLNVNRLGRSTFENHKILKTKVSDYQFGIFSALQIVDKYMGY